MKRSCLFIFAECDTILNRRRELDEQSTFDDGPGHSIRIGARQLDIPYRFRLQSIQVGGDPRVLRASATTGRAKLVRGMSQAVKGAHLSSPG